MRLRLRRPRDLALALRDLARRRPREAEEYLEAHSHEWESLASAEPQNAADILEAIDDETGAELVADLDSPQAAQVVAEMRPDAAVDLLEGLEASEIAGLLIEMSDDDAADVIGQMDQARRDEMFEALPDELGQRLTGLLSYPPDSAGGLMTAAAATLHVGLTSGEAIEALRRMHETVEQLAYVYVVDHEQRLQGVISFRELVFARPGTGIEEAMIQNPVAVRPETDREDVAKLIQRYGLLSVPVVDHRGLLLGIVTVDEVLEAVQEEAGEDIAVMVGAGFDETIHASVATSVRNRLPWIIVNLAIAFAVAGVVSRFEPLISEIAVLAAYMPVVASVGGNGGAQSLAIVIRALAIEDIP
ncbi:MAG: magnesium transporter, partial [Acidimicrobiia bacterium]|nr:magnesium transporter [Acidimicrobiia bacterium]